MTQIEKKTAANMEDISRELFERATFEADQGEKTAYSNYSYWRSTFRIFIRQKSTVITLVAICLVLLMCAIQPLLPNQKDPLQIFMDPATGLQLANQQPCSEFWWGTNSLGQDMWARIWSGTRTSLFIGLTVGLVQAAVGIVVGALWGYVRSLDRPLTEIYNVLNNIPSTIIMVLMSYILRPSLSTIIIAMCITEWLPMARFVRNQIVIIRDREYNLASRCLGTPVRRMIYKNLLPFLISVIMMRLALAIPAAIGYEVFLTFVGLGLPVSIPSLGNLINSSRGIIMSPDLRYQMIYPSLMLSVITVSCYLLGSNFADAADPKNHV